MKDGHGVDWPIRYKDIEPWYRYVEKFVGISGSKEGLAHLPDSDFIAPMEMNCLEKHVATQISQKYTDRRMIIGRIANLTQPAEGRGPASTETFATGAVRLEATSAVTLLPCPSP
jgi:choline dehydrogenase-like flavoprotein